MMENTTLYCELITTEQVAEFEKLMTDLGFDEMERPARWARRAPHWVEEGSPRGKNEDPLAVIILTLFHKSAQYFLESAYRCTEGNKIEPNVMNAFIRALRYSRIER